MKRTKRPHTHGRLKWAVLAVISAFSSFAHAGATTDGTMGAVQSLSGNFTVPQALGTINGGNLFHSFQNFSINTGESATFTTTSSLSNVISRVTGGSASSINGALRLSAASGSSPNFFFINPAGVTFGAGASVDVPAGFHVSTANYLKFSDGGILYADPSQASTLSAATPDKFGFLGTTRATITAQGGATIMSAPLNAISISAGDIEVNNATIGTVGGDVRMVANGAVAQEIGWTTSLPAALGTLNVSSGSRVGSITNGAMNAGDVSISAGNITIDGTGSSTETGLYSQAGLNSTGSAGTVDVKAALDLSIKNGGRISSSTYGAGDAGVVVVNAKNIDINGMGKISGIFINTSGTGSGRYADVTATENITIQDTGVISANTSQTGYGGQLNVQAANISITGGTGATGIIAETFGAGHALPINPSPNSGTSDAVVVKTTGNLTLTANNAKISSNTYGDGNAGVVNIQTNGDLTLNSGGLISSSTSGSVNSSTSIAGNAGAVKVSAANITINAAGNQITGLSSSAETKSNGSAGSVEVNATGNLTILEGGKISSATMGEGDAGIVQVRANDISINGKGKSSGIFTDTQGAGDGKYADVIANNNLSIENGGAITASTRSTGYGGQLNIQAKNITLVGAGATTSTNTIPTGIIADTYGPGQASPNNPSPNSGSATDSIVVKVTDALSISNGAKISSATYGSGDAGGVLINPGTISNASTISLASGGQISASTASSGYAGQLNVQANTISINGGSSSGGSLITGILVEASGSGHASPRTAGSTGSTDAILVKTTGNLSVTGGKISSGTYAGGNAGVVNIQAGGDLNLSSGGTISSSTVDLPMTVATGNAGAVKVSAANVTIDGASTSATPQLTGLMSSAEVGSTGAAGSVEVNVTGNLSVLEGGQISSSTNGVGDAGIVTVNANNISLDGKGGRPTGIFINTFGAGNGKYADVKATENITIENSGVIAAATLSSGYGGQLYVQAKNISISGGNASTAGINANSPGTGIFAETAGTGHALPNNPSPNSGSNDAIVVKVTGNLSVSGNLTRISSNTYGNGDAGVVSVQTNGDLKLSSGAAISSSSMGSLTATSPITGKAGRVNVSAGSITIDGAGGTTSQTGLFSSAEGKSDGKAGAVDVDVTGNLTILEGGKISSSTMGAGDAGIVTVDANNISINGKGKETGIFINTQGAGNGWYADVVAKDSISMENGGQINATTRSTGYGGQLYVQAASLSISGGSVDTGIIAETYGSGHAQPNNPSPNSGSSDAILVKTTGNLSLTGNKAKISSNTYGNGNAGVVNVKASGNLTLSSTGTISSSTNGSQDSQTAITGNAGTVKVSAGNLTIDGAGVNGTTGLSSSSEGKSNGYAGAVDVEVTGNLTILEGGKIASSTMGAGDAGIVEIDANNISINGKGKSTGIVIDTRGSGNGKYADIQATESISIENGGVISASTSSSGYGGQLNVQAKNISITGSSASGGALTGIIAEAFGTGNASPITPAPNGSSEDAIVVKSSGNLSVTNSNTKISSNTFGDGNAGIVNIQVGGDLTLSNKGTISSSTGSTGGPSSTKTKGSAGLVKISAANVTASGGSSITSSAEDNSSGQTGKVTVVATNSVTLSGDSKFSIENKANVGSGETPELGKITVSAPNVTLVDSKITAASTGNVAASDITISYTNRMYVDPSSITTSANNAAGGAITIVGTGPLIVDRSQITTSVTGTAGGNGGDITISVPVLVLNTGFIQANTEAAASGGNVAINVDSIITSGNSLIVGGTQVAYEPNRFGYNVIQAANPDGVNGNIQISSPQIDLSGSLNSVTAQILDFSNLAADMCRIGSASSLTPLGRGGMPITSISWIRP